MDESYYSKQSFKYGEASNQQQSYILVLKNQQEDSALSSHGYSLDT